MDTVKHTVEHIADKFGWPSNGRIVENVTRDDLYVAFRELNFTKGVEVGVYRGRNARVLFDTIPDLNLYLVDAYLQVGPKGWRTAKKQRHYFRRMKEKLAAEVENGQAHIILKWSLDAVKDFEDKSLDFVYIDANHNFDFVIQDIILWTPKVRKGGIVAGHDYYHAKKSKNIGVVDAVDAYVNHHKLDWYLLDREKTSRSRMWQTNNTWFWVKK